ncbi:uncharacterized protein PV09_07328 [Verruconis gallopava]|uniref:Zinc finger PHD-type domain-containing protein n=1 Tax=Verruconis gallopava TaxID=253628 RepID=A0A0D2A398_9PEZI|nr:uncharacterized protein PV09_07328 [Verruconis gallopava]KIW01288.1 hypothetical protein PV09_07328 [Verruconis gallopava]
MPARKRAYDEVESEDSIPEVSAELSTLKRIRGMWEFAALMQYLFFFGKAVKVEDMDVEDFEDECLKPGPSEKLNQIALALLKNVSSHKGLTLDLLDEYARRQYVAKAPKRNPFGEDDEPRKFADFDIFTKIRVLQQLATWTLNNPNPIREKLGERESEEVSWRIEPFGWDKEDRVYFVLDDNRLYRRTDAPPPPEIVSKPPTKSKAKAKKPYGRNTRSAKRPRIGRRIIETSPEETEDEPEAANGVEKEESKQDDFFMQRWELIAVTIDEYNEFLDTIRKSRDPNEKSLVKRIQDHVMPILVEAEQERKRKEMRRMKELEMMQKLAASKRSSRLADKQDRLRQEREAAEAEERRRRELEMAHREQKRLQQMEAARESRRETREQRMREREIKRILEQERLEKEQELLQRIKTEGAVIDAQRGRISERQLKADMQKRKKELENLQQDDSWYFDCVCGIHGQNLDDGSHSIACERCSTWQHSKCNNISEAQAEREDFHFVCQDCKKKEENPVKIKLKMASESPAKPSKPKATSESNSIPAKNKANGAAPLVYPGPPPVAPSINGTRPQNNSNGPTTFQWHAYTPPQPMNYTPPRSTNQQSHGPNTQKSPGRTPTGPASFSHQTVASFSQSYSPPRQTSTYTPPRAVNQVSSTSPRPSSQQLPSIHQISSPSTASFEHQSLSPQRATQALNSKILPPLQHSDQMGSPSKRAVSTGFGPIIPPPQLKSPVTNGTHHVPTPSAPYAIQNTTPATQPALYTASSPSDHGQTPFNAAPGYSPTKQPSPKLASSPTQFSSVASPAIVSPQTAPAAHFSPPKSLANSNVSPTKHASSPVHAPPASLGQVPNMIASSSSATSAQIPTPVLQPSNQEPGLEQRVLPPAQPVPQKASPPTQLPPIQAPSGRGT